MIYLGVRKTYHSLSLANCRVGFNLLAHFRAGFTCICFFIWMVAPLSHQKFTKFSLVGADEIRPT